MKYLWAICAMAFTNGWGQPQTRIIDAETGLPVPYVNIGVVAKGIGTVSAENGTLNLDVSQIDKDQIIRFSSIGYEPIEITVAGFAVLQAQQHSFAMTPRTTLLQEIEVRPEKIEQYQLGHLPGRRSTNAGFVTNRLGHEVGTLFHNNSGAQYLDSVQLNFAICEYDSVLVRLNIYSAESDSFENILPENILLAWSKKKVLSRPVVDLTRFNLPIGKEFLVSIEIVKDMGPGKLWFYAKLNINENSTRYRSTSQSIWQTGYDKKKRPFGISIFAFVH